MNALRNVVVVLAILGLSSLALAQEKKKDAAEKPLRGVVAAVAADGKSLTVKTGRGGDAKEVVVAVDDKTTVQLDDKPAKLADLKVGFMVKVSPATGTAQKIVANSEVPKKDNPKKGDGAKKDQPKH